MKKTGFYLLTCVLIFLLSCKSGNDFHGKWVINQSGLLLSSNEADKLDIYNSCNGKNIIFSNDSVYFDSNCIFFQDIYSLSKPEKTNLPMRALSINNPERLLANIFGTYRSEDEASISNYILKKKSESCRACDIYMFIVSKNKMAIVDEPYFIILERDNGSAESSRTKK